MLLVKLCICVCLGDEGHLPVDPPPPHLGPPLAHLPAHDEPGGVGGEEMGTGQGVTHGRDGVPGPTPEVEEATEDLDHGGDMTGQDHGPTTETDTETGTETESGTEMEIETGEDIRTADEQGWIKLPTCYCAFLFLFF